MDGKKPRCFGQSDKGQDSANQLRQGATETLDLSRLFAAEVTDSGSFDIGSAIWTSTFGKVIQALPIPALLINEAQDIVVANQAWKKIGVGPERIVGRPFVRLFAEHSADLKGESIVRTVFATRKTATWESSIEIEDNKIWGRFTFRPVRIKGERFLLVLVEDLSLEKKQKLQDEKHREELERRVLERTEDLRSLNEKLLAEIADRKRSGEALRNGEERYRRLFDKAPLMYVITRNRKGAPFISDCNELLLSSLGYSRKEVVGKPLADFYSPPSRVALLEGGGYARALAGEYFMGERELVTRQGTLVPTLLYTATELDSSGQVTGTRAMFVDITERKRVEQALKESEERFRAVFDSDHAVMLIIDPETGAIVDGSPGACAFYGYDREELKTKKIIDINTLTPDEIFERLQMAKSRQSRYFEFRHRVADGEVRDVEVCTGPIVVGGRSLLFSIINDVTDRKRAEEAFLKSETKYRALFDESKDGVYSSLRAGEITDANPSFLEMFGFTREEMIGKDIHELYADPADRTRFQEEIEKKGFVKDYELALRRKDRTEIGCLLTASVQFGDDGSVVGYRGIMRDLTIRKRLQKQLFQAQKMEAIGTLAGGIAHDFNNLLTVVLGFSELLLIGKDERDPAYADLQKINQAARSGADLVKRILAFSRKTEINPRPLNLNHEIEQVKKLLTRTIPKMIEVELLLHEGLATVNADPIQVEQILMNLAVNAKDAMPDGGKLTIETRNVALDEQYCSMHHGAKPGEYVLLTVSDSGQGMDEETLNHIFEPFYTTKEPGLGTGLGLAIVYGIVQQHNGYTTCDSEPGGGTAFGIYLPVIPPDERSKTPVEKPKLPRGTETVLIVDDEEMVRDLGKRILERAGYTVLTAAGGQQALDLYSRHGGKVSLVVLDLIMPEMGGKQCLEELLKLDPMATVLIASGYFQGGAEHEAVKGGAKGFVGKPFDMNQLAQAVRTILDAG
ncbi:MAG: PAS domain S-box protein [Desulfomonile tiedjei]|nr:PAS domain S-box protein [Desulfomonile tiedjei]